MNAWIPPQIFGSYESTEDQSNSQLWWPAPPATCSKLSVHFEFQLLQSHAPPSDSYSDRPMIVCLTVKISYCAVQLSVASIYIGLSGPPSTDISPHRCIVADPVYEFGVGSALAVLSHRVGVQEETINLSQGKFHGSLPEVM